MKWFWPALFVFLFVRCGEGSETKSSKLNYVFLGLVEQAQTATFPLELISTDPLPKSKRLRQITLRKYNPFLPGSGPHFLYCKCYENDSTICLIFVKTGVVTSPRLFSYNKFTGSKIDSLDLFINNGAEKGYFRMNKMTLNTNRILNYYDSTSQSQTDNTGNPIAGTERITILKKKFALAPEGFIKTLSEKNTVR